MSTYKDVIDWNKRITELIKQGTSNPAPKGLHEAIDSVKGRIAEKTVKQCRYLATVRNRLVHESDAQEVPVEFNLLASEAFESISTELGLEPDIVNPLRPANRAPSNSERDFSPLIQLGTYKGKCENLTYGGEADILLTIHTISGCSVSGHIHISGELCGTSSAAGVLSSTNRITLHTDSGEGMPITWLGICDEDSIHGDYHVSVSSELKANGLKDSVGHWSAKRI